MCSVRVVKEGEKREIQSEREHARARAASLGVRVGARTEPERASASPLPSECCRERAPPSCSLLGCARCLLSLRDDSFLFFFFRAAARAYICWAVGGSRGARSVVMVYLFSCFLLDSILVLYLD